MSTDRETTRIVRSWLEDGVTRLPDNVLDAVLDQLPATHQRRATWWPARRYQFMNMLKFGLAAAVVVIAALLGVNYLGANVGGPGVADPTPSPTPTPVAALAGQEDLAAGRYLIASGISMRVTAAVPNGWSAIDSWGVRGPLGHEAPDGSGIRFYTVGNLFNNPSSYADGLQDPPVGPTVDDLIEAIVEQAEWTSSTPSDTTIGGYPAKHARITIPDGAEFDSRDGGAFYLFQDEGSGQIWGFEVGQMFDVYVVDVDGERLVLDAFHYPGTAETDLTALQAVVESIEIGPSD
jgi:hypothetical protein